MLLLLLHIKIINNMDNFTELIKESRKNYDSASLLSSEISRYLTKVNKVIPKHIQHIIYLTQKYNLLDSNSIDSIRNANKGSLNALSIKYDIPLDVLENLWKSLKELKSNIKLLPQYQSQQERDAIQLGKLSMDDLTIDLDTAAGRNAATKMYMPMVYKIVNQYVGKSSLSKQELISAALHGFTNAMNDWKRNDDPEQKKVVFKTYAGYRVQQQILNDINEFSHTLSGTNWYAAKTQGDKLDAISIDGLSKGDDDDFKQDHFASLGVEDKSFDHDEDKLMNILYKLIENNFKQRDVDIFYRYFGLHGYKREKSKDIAKSMGMSEGNIRNSVINKIISFLKKNKRAAEILSDIQDIYNESLMIELMGFDKNEILEALINDDMFILLEELNMWKNKIVFNNALNNSLSKIGNNEDVIIDLLSNDFEYLDSNYKKNKKLIINFLSSMYPTTSFRGKSDVELLEMMEELQGIFKTHNINV